MKSVVSVVVRARWVCMCKARAAATCSGVRPVVRASATQPNPSTQTPTHPTRAATALPQKQTSRPSTTATVAAAAAWLRPRRRRRIPRAAAAAAVIPPRRSLMLMMRRRRACALSGWNRSRTATADRPSACFRQDGRTRQRGGGGADVGHVLGRARGSRRRAPDISIEGTAAGEGRRKLRWVRHALFVVRRSIFVHCARFWGGGQSKQIAWNAGSINGSVSFLSFCSPFQDNPLDRPQRPSNGP